MPAAIVSLAALAGSGFDFERRQVLDDVRFLEDFFKFEFFFSGITPEALLDETLTYFASREVVVSLDGGDNRYTLSASGLKKELAYFANLLYNYLESYYVVFRSVRYLQKKPPERKGIPEAHHLHRPEILQPGGSGALRGLVRVQLSERPETFRGKGHHHQEAPRWQRQGRHHLQPPFRRGRQGLLRPPAGPTLRR